VPWFLNQFFSFSAKLGQFQVLNKSLQGLQEFGNEEDKSIRKRIEICKSLQTLQRFAGGEEAK
jgi:hypothetical protein